MSPITLAMWVVFGVNPCSWVASLCTFLVCILLVVFAGGVAWHVLKPIRDEINLVVDECIKEQVELRTNKFQNEAFSTAPCSTLRSAACSEDPTKAECAQAGGQCVCRLAKQFDSIRPQMLEDVGQCCKEFDGAPKFGGFFQKADEMCHLHADHVMSRMTWVHGNCTEGRAPYWHDDLFWSTDLNLTMPVHLREGDSGLQTLVQSHAGEASFLPVQLFEASSHSPLLWSSSRIPPVETLLSGIAMSAVLAAVASAVWRQRRRAAPQHHELTRTVAEVWSTGDAFVAARDEEELLLVA